MQSAFVLTHFRRQLGDGKSPTQDGFDSGTSLMRWIVQWLVVVGCFASLGAQHATTNFVVTARSKELAQQVAEVAEHEREQLAIAWFGHKLEPWYRPCKVSVQDGPQLGAGGKTKFRFEQGEVSGWDMSVQGSVERILDSVIPHEVNHTILACYFRRPVPRWADEGAASLFEHASEVKKQQDLVNQLMQNGRRIPLRVMLDMAEYPVDMSQTLALYAQGYSLTYYLVQHKGRSQFLKFLTDAEKRGWDTAIQSFYGQRNIETLERDWCSWVLAGSPRVTSFEESVFAQAQPRPVDPSQVRGQSPNAASTLKQLRQQIRQESSAAVAAKPEAPDPRQQPPKHRANSLSASAVESLPNRVPSEPFVPQKPTASLPTRRERQPIELIRIDAK